MRPCNLCPHMKRITLPKIRRALETMQHEVTIDPAVAARRAPRRRAHAGDPLGGRHGNHPPGTGRRSRDHRRRPGRTRDGAAAGAAARDPARQDAARRRAPPRPGRRAASPPPWARTTIRRCMPPTPWRPATGSAIPPSLPASPRRRRPPSPSCSATASPSTATPTGRFALGLEAAHGRRRIVHVARRRHGGGDHARAGRGGARPRPRSPSSRGWRRAACWSTIAALSGVLAAGPCERLPAADAVASCSPPAGWAVSTPHTTNPLGAIGQGAGAGRPRRRGARRHGVRAVPSDRARRRARSHAAGQRSRARRGRRAGRRDRRALHGRAGPRRARAARRRLARRGRAHRRRPPRLPRCARRRWVPASRRTSPASQRAAGPPASIPAIQPIPVRPAAHYHMGGIAVDARGPQHASKACGRAARRRRRACTAPTVWPATRCSRRW